MMHYTKSDPDSIRKMFNSIARQYDRTNAVLSLQMHKRWNNQLVKKVLTTNRPARFLDLCCGTGAIAFSYLEKQKQPVKAHLLDFSEGMLHFAKEQAKKMDLIHHDLHYLQADAQSIPLPDKSVDCITIAYGIRNIKQPKHCIAEAYRTLDFGGSFGILELTKPHNPFMRIGHKIYLKTILPIMGKLLTSNKEAYQYLCNSIDGFIHPDELEELLLRAGFHSIKRHSFLGGIATLLIAQK